MTDVRLEGVGKRFRDVTALSCLDLEIVHGEFYCLFGPSAAGKTTTLRTIAGLTRPDSGRVICGGIDVTHEPVQGRDVAMVFQTFALYPHLTVEANFAYPLKEAGLSRKEIRTRVGETAEMLRVSHTLKRKPDTLSGGEQQRVAIGRALVRRPSLLLLDEPLTNLDAKLRHDTRVEFKRLHREMDMTLVYATPDQLEALSLGERIGVMKDGAIVQVGTPDELYDFPQDTYVGAMLGSPTMNLVEAKTDGTDSVALPFAGFDVSRWRGALAAGNELLVGIRPQSLTPVWEGSTAHGPTFNASVHLTEPLGDVTVLDIEAAGTVMKMALPEEEALAFPTGTELAVAFRPDAAHLFDKESGKALA